jgi:predicted TIM-barrel fold metal-dependent hydrolase
MGDFMLSRRDVLFGMAAAGAAALGGRVSRALAKASQPATRVDFDVPAGACDCHTHIFGDPRHFPFAAGRIYTPEPASVAEMRSLHRALHTERVVLVQPSVYGSDNACTLDAMKQLGRSSRGIAVIDEKTTEAALDDMHRTGIRGIRINLETAGQTDPGIGRQRLQAAIARIKGRRWHIQIYTRLPVIEGMADLVMAAPVPIVFDHFGGAQGSLGVQQRGFETLLKLVRAGKAYVKLSAPYRSSTQPPDYPDVAPLAKALIAANPERMLWATDWPHPAQIPGRKFDEVTPLYHIDDGRVFNLLPRWAPASTQRRTILVSNPAKLYDF